MVVADSLTEQDLTAARADLAGGKPFTVWFTSAAVGVPVNGSARVVSVGDPADGDFIQVKPAGTRDTMFCSPGELTRTRPPRKPASKPAAPAGAGAAAPGVVPARSPTPAPTAAPTPVPDPTPAPAPAVAPLTPPATAAPAPAPISTPTSLESVPAQRAEGRRPAGGRARRPTDVTVTLSATPEGEWTVEVVVGAKRTVRAMPVQPGDVAKAARSLPAEVTEAIEASLDAARQRQLDRVERLRAELEAAQRALHDLTS